MVPSKEASFPGLKSARASYGALWGMSSTSTTCFPPSASSCTRVYTRTVVSISFLASRPLKVLARRSQ